MAKKLAVRVLLLLLAGMGLAVLGGVALANGLEAMGPGTAVVLVVLALVVDELTGAVHRAACLLLLSLRDEWLESRRER